MSAISSSTGPDLYQWLQQVGLQPSTSASPNPVATAATQAQNALSNPQDPNATDTASATPHHHGHHQHQNAAGKIESAVTSALQSAPDGSDPNQIIKDAITKALQSGNSQSNNANNPSPTTTNTNGSNTSGTSDPFTQLLQSHGINPQQFQQDLQDALSTQSSGGSSVDFATLFKNFAPGSLLQTTG